MIPIGRESTGNTISRGKTLGACLVSNCVVEYLYVV
jgi:hypothetical protein